MCNHEVLNTGALMTIGALVRRRENNPGYARRCRQIIFEACDKIAAEMPMEGEEW